MSISIPLAVPVAVVVIGTLIASITDVWKFKIHNLLTFPLMLSGLLYHGFVGGATGLANSSLGLAFGFGALLVFFMMGGVGAGDVKLMAAVGAWLGMPLTFYVFIASSLATGVYAVVLLSMGSNLRESWINFQLVLFRLMTMSRHLGSDNRVESEVLRIDRRRRLIPFAAMMMVGLLSILAYSWKTQAH